MLFRSDFINRIPLSDPAAFALLDIPHFEDSLVIFDDCEAGLDKNMRKLVYALQNNILMNGRSRNIYCIVTSHITLGNHDTKTVLAECKYFVIFVDTSIKAKKSLLETYAGLSAENVKKIANMDDRWVMVKRSHPKYAITDDQVFLIEDKL